MTTKQTPVHSGYGVQTTAREVTVPANFPELRGVRPWVMDTSLAERLWTRSEEWTSVPFTA